MINKSNFAFDRVNFILLAVGMAVVVVGMMLMAGPGSDETHFNPEIFSARRVKVAPLVSLAGYVFMVYAVIRRPRTKRETPAERSTDNPTA